MIYPWLQQAFERFQQGPPPQALLVSGPRGMGISVFAHQVVQGLFCERPTANRSGCGACSPCQWIMAGSHPDFRLLEPESAVATGSEIPRFGGVEENRSGSGSVWITVDAVRSLNDFLVLSTHRTGYRVVLVDPAEALNPSAANALLKVLEEPRPGTIFMLVSERPTRIPATILSRCQHLKLGLPAPRLALAWLESQSIPNAEHWLALAGQAPLEAQRLALQDQGERSAWLQAFTGGQLTLIQLSEQTAKLPLPEWLDWLQRWVFDLIEFKSLGQVRYHLAFSAQVARMSERFSLLDLLAWEMSLREGRRLMQHPLNPRLLAEQLLLPCYPSH